MNQATAHASRLKSPPSHATAGPPASGTLSSLKSHDLIASTGTGNRPPTIAAANFDSIKDAGTLNSLDMNLLDPADGGSTTTLVAGAHGTRFMH